MGKQSQSGYRYLGIIVCNFCFVQAEIFFKRIIVGSFIVWVRVFFASRLSVSVIEILGIRLRPLARFSFRL